MKRRGFLQQLLVLMLVGTAGCTGFSGCPGCNQYNQTQQRGDTYGQVTYQGQPLPYGLIYFDPDASKGNAGPAGFGEINNGTYRTAAGSGVGGGPYVVRIYGWDGQPQGTMFPHGMPLGEFQLRSDLPSGGGPANFAIP